MKAREYAKLVAFKMKELISTCSREEKKDEFLHDIQKPYKYYRDYLSKWTAINGLGDF